MIDRKSKPPTLHLSTPSPETSPRGSPVLSDCDADDEGAMSMEDSLPSRPLSMADTHGVGPYFPERPTLRDILSNSAPAPWSLSAFTAYLSHNHCLETLEFTLDAGRYRQRYETMLDQIDGQLPSLDRSECRHVMMLWQRLMEAYIIPNGPREINLPGEVRDELLSLSISTAPPSPEELDTAVQIIYELMDGSVLLPFLNAVSPVRSMDRAASLSEGRDEPEESLYLTKSVTELPQGSSSQSGSRRVSPQLQSLDIVTHSWGTNSNRSPPAQVFSRSRFQAHGSSSSTGSADGSMTDDSNSLTSPISIRESPMTPPTTPPSSDIGGSPRTRRDNTWKRMIRLGVKKKSSSRMRSIDDDVAS